MRTEDEIRSRLSFWQGVEKSVNILPTVDNPEVLLAAEKLLPGSGEDSKGESKRGFASLIINSPSP